MRAAIYARMSTDKQSAESPEDQIARCREFAGSRGWTVLDDCIAVDAGVSGASRHNRPELLRLMQRIGEWDVLLCFESSRIARNQEDFGWVLNQLEEHDREGYEAMTGQPLASFGTRILGVVNEEERHKIRERTHSGLRGRMERGLATGGAPFGYCNEAVAGGGSRIVVVPEQAAVVRRIFTMYANGDGIRLIAHQLNTEGVPPPRPRSQKDKAPSWSPNAIREMLRNELYRGERIWNRSRWIKRRDGGRRRLPRPDSDWIRKRDDSLRIVDEDLWARVRDELQGRSVGMQLAVARRGRNAGQQLRVPRAIRGGQPRHLLSGFLECAECGGAVHALKGARFGCSWHRDRGQEVCSNSMAIDPQELEERVLRALREQVLVTDVVAHATSVALEELHRKLENRDEEADLRRLEELDRQVANLVGALGLVEANVPELAEELARVQRERDGVRARLAALPPRLTVEDLRPAIEEALCELRDVLAGPEGRQALRALLGGERLKVAPDGERGFRIGGVVRVGPDVLVAGGGFEPPTSGL